MEKYPTPRKTPPSLLAPEMEVSEHLRKDGHILTIHDLRAKGKNIQQIAKITGYSRNTIRRYLAAREIPEPKPRSRRPAKLAPSYRACANRCSRVYSTATGCWLT